MSVANGYKDIMIEKQDDGRYRVFGLSPAGHKWCDTHLTFAGRVEQEYLGEVVSMAVMTMSVEIR